MTDFMAKGKDKIYGGSGNDFIMAEVPMTDFMAKERIKFMVDQVMISYGGSSNDRLYGQRGKDKIYGGSKRQNLWWKR